MPKFTVDSMCEICGQGQNNFKNAAQFREHHNLHLGLKNLFGFSKTLKNHIIEHHIKDYIKMTEMPLGRRTDQVTEAAHQVLFNYNVIKIR